MAGGVSHNIGQLMVAALIVENTSLLYYAPVLLISGVVTGLLIGILTKEVTKEFIFKSLPLHCPIFYFCTL